MPPPTAKQLALLAKMNYRGESPLSVDEASFLIDLRKEGMKSESMSRLLLKRREKDGRAWWRSIRREKMRDFNDLLEQGPEGPEHPPGIIVRLCDDCRSRDKAGRDGAFLQYELGFRNPKLIPPYEGLARYPACECSYDIVNEGDRIPKRRLDAKGSAHARGCAEVIGCTPFAMTAGILLLAILLTAWALGGGSRSVAPTPPPPRPARPSAPHNP